MFLYFFNNFIQENLLSKFKDSLIDENKISKSRINKNLIHIHFYFLNYCLIFNKIIFYSNYTFKKFVKIPIWLFCSILFFLKSK